MVFVLVYANISSIEIVPSELESEAKSLDSKKSDDILKFLENEAIDLKKLIKKRIIQIYDW